MSALRDVIEASILLYTAHVALDVGQRDYLDYLTEEESEALFELVDNMLKECLYYRNKYPGLRELSGPSAIGG